MGFLREIAFDCNHAPSLARFWGNVLEDYEIRPYDEDETARLTALGLTPETDPTVMVDGPGPSLCFQQVAGRDYENSRIHLDIETPDVGREIARLCLLGASVHRESGRYVVMKDPEGNQFCVSKGVNES